MKTAKILKSAFAVAIVLALCLSMIPMAMAAECHLVEGVGYTVSAENANGTMYFKGTITNGRFDGTTNAAEAALVYVEVVSGGYLMYVGSGSSKTYINMDDKSQGALSTTNAAEATVYEWNSTYNTLEVADDDNARGFGCGPTATYMNFSSYALSNGTQYNWGQFVAATSTPPASSEPATSEPATSEPATSEPATSEPATSAPVASEEASSTPAPKPTGDNTNMIGMAVVMVLAVTALAALVIGNKKRSV